MLVPEGYEYPPAAETPPPVILNPDGQCAEPLHAPVTVQDILPWTIRVSVIAPPRGFQLLPLQYSIAEELELYLIVPALELLQLEDTDPNLTPPATSSLAEGEVVPIPTSPSGSIAISGVVLPLLRYNPELAVLYSVQILPFCVAGVVLDSKRISPASLTSLLLALRIKLPLFGVPISIILSLFIINRFSSVPVLLFVWVKKRNSGLLVLEEAWSMFQCLWVEEALWVNSMREDTPVAGVPVPTSIVPWTFKSR
jgi:hypothetical protein